MKNSATEEFLGDKTSVISFFVRFDKTSMNMQKIETFVKRMNRIGINVKLIANYPWIYLDEINGVKVKEKYMADHGFTLAFSGVKSGENSKFTDIRTIFKLIRKYGRR